jgi:hypothetical protein
VLVIDFSPGFDAPCNTVDETGVLTFEAGTITIHSHHRTVPPPSVQALRHHIATCQRRGWREREPTDALAAAAWALAHGIAVLRMQGSLARHYPDPSLSGVGQLVTAMTATADRPAQA